MTQSKDFDIVGSYDNQRSSTFNAERTVNMFEYSDPNAKRPKALFYTSGLQDAGVQFTGVTEDAPSRASFIFNNKNTGLVEEYQVFGDGVFLITGATNNLVVTRIGSLNTSSGYVGCDANEFQIIFVDGENGFIWDINQEAYEQITDTGFPSRPIDVTYLDGFFTVANGQTNTFQLSSYNQGMVWSGGSATFTASTIDSKLTLSTDNANFATGVPVLLTTTGTLPNPLTTMDTYYVIRQGTATTFPGEIKLAATYEDAIAGTFIPLTTNGTPTNTITVNAQLQLGSMTSHPGTIVACRTLHRRLFLFSQFYTEVWENAGIGTNLPFRRNNSLLMEVGTPAIGSISVGFDRLFFLSQDKDGIGSVMEVQGTESIPVSTRALDYHIAQYAADPALGVSDARGIMIKENGLIFYRLNFTAANHTYVLNVSLSTQDDPKWHEEEVLNGDRHIAQTHAFYNGVNYYFSYNQPKMYIVSDTLPDNDGETIRRMRIGKDLAPAGYNRLRIDRFQLDVKQGEVEQIYEESDLLAETGSIILSEAGDNILLSQETSYQGEQPVIFLQISRDGGQSWGTYFKADMGAIGQRTFRTVWRKLGTIQRGQGFTPKIEFFNKIPFIILGASWNYEIMPQ